MPSLNINLIMRPKTIQVGPGGYLVSVFIEDQLAFSLPTLYNSYDEAREATLEYMYERLKSD